MTQKIKPKETFTKKEISSGYSTPSTSFQYSPHGYSPYTLEVFSVEHSFFAIREVITGLPKQNTYEFLRFKGFLGFY